MKKYNPLQIEKKWQKTWYHSTAFKAKNNSRGKKLYLLNEFPYPSGDGLHVGHCRPYIGLDVVARKKRLEGFNVLYPMGWDAFGLPTENFAIKKGVHPAVVTKKNTANFRRQMDLLGLSFDWSREVNTTDPKYYKWTQWIFLKLFEHGLAYKGKMNINWCPSCKTGLANEEVINGACERCGTKVEKREKEQWLIKITQYAERLLEDLHVVDYPERVKTQQREWIGKSPGALVKFPVENVEDPIEVFTTRIDTIFSGTFLILSPGHPFLDRHQNKIENWEEVLAYRQGANAASDIERTKADKEVTGVEVKGILARNPATDEEIPVWVADFVLEQYGTGAVFADAHDARDFALAKKHGIPLRTSIMPPHEELAHKVKNLEECYEGEGVLYNSMQFDGMTSQEAKPKIILWLKQKNMADVATNYKLRDWVFSRQHYWGEPIPMIYCEDCKWQPVPEKELPVELPNVKKYKPGETGESPLAAVTKWVNVKCPTCKKPAKRETDTMPNWAGSNWYFLRYVDPTNSKHLADERLLKQWMPVDWYNGGMEHTTLHLLYSRFIYKFLWDIGAVPKIIGSEPYKKRTSHGIILGPGGIKMSKSKGNVINPDDVARRYGVDTLRVYEMFMGPFEQMIPWDEKGIIGARRFLEKVYVLAQTKGMAKKTDDGLKVLLHKTIKKITEDIDAIKFNTCVSALMEFTNAWHLSAEGLEAKDLQKFLAIVSPFAPHLAAELGLKETRWPKYDEKLLQEENVMLIVQINGKVRDKIEARSGLDQAQAEGLIMQSEKIQQWLGGNKPKKVIYVPNKLINIVV